MNTTFPFLELKDTLFVFKSNLNRYFGAIAEERKEERQEGRKAECSIPVFKGAESHCEPPNRRPEVTSEVQRARSANPLKR